MVFMQYKTFHDGSREELDVRVIDVGIGLERVAWLYNGSSTSYSDTFAHALTQLLPKLDVKVD
jgi:alanyl-tRNA synthetase